MSWNGGLGRVARMLLLEWLRIKVRHPDRERMIWPHLAACLGRDQEGRAAAGLVLCLVETRAELLPPLAVGRPVQPAVVFRTPAAAAVRRYFADASPILRRYFGGLLVGFGRVRVGGLGQGPLDQAEHLGALTEDQHLTNSWRGWLGVLRLGWLEQRADADL